MTNDEPAVEIERLCEAYDAAESAWRTDPKNTLYWDYLVEQKCRLADVTRGRLPAILAALRTPAATVDEDAVERVMAVVENAFTLGVRLAHGRSHVGEQWLINNNWGRYRERLMPQARAALAAMPGVGVVPTRDQLVSALQGAWDEFCGDAQAHPECFWREGRKLYADFDRSNFVQMVQYHLAAALSAAPPPAAESRAGEVKAENADGCPHCGSEFLGGDEENYPGWACGSYRMDNGQIVQEGDCERRELKRLLSEAPVPEPAAGESWDA